MLGGGAGGGAEDAARIAGAVSAARSSGDWLRGLRRDLSGLGPRDARAVLDEASALRTTHREVLARLAEGGPGVVVPLAKSLTAAAKQRRERLADRHALELGQLEEAYGVEGPRGWPPGVRTRIEKRFERIQRAEEQRTLRLLLDDLAGWLRDLVALRAGSDPSTLINGDVRAALAHDVDLLAPADLLEGLFGVQRCRAALDRNGAPELHLERLLLALATSLYVRQRS